MTTENISPAAQPESATLPSETNPPQRILVVDDDADIRRLNTEALVDAGYYVDSAKDGAAAWDALQLNSYDLLLTDNKMPKLSGMELLQKLHTARMELPVILVTGVPPTEQLKRQPWLQIEAMLFKPYTAEELLATVRNVLHEIDNAPRQIATPDYWQSQPLRNGLRL